MKPSITKENFLNVFLIIFLFIYFYSMVLVDGYPHNNDILFIFKITSLDGNFKFINGLYGPGFAYYSLIFSNSLSIFNLIVSLLIITSSYFVSILTRNFILKIKNNKNIFILLTLISHLIIIISPGFNPSETMFLYTFYNGFLMFFYGFYLIKKKIFIFLGILFLGISVLFRQHGIVALFFLYLFFVIFETFIKDKPLIYNYKKYLIYGFSLILPITIAYSHLFFINSFEMWQTKFRLHMIFFVNEWGDWRNLKNVLVDYNVKNFSIFDLEKDIIFKEFKNFSLHALKIIYPFIICFLIVYYYSRKLIVLLALIFFLSFVMIVLPGFHKGYFPILLLCFIVILSFFDSLSDKKIPLYTILFFLIGHLFYLTEKYYENFNEKYRINNDINKNLVHLFKKENLEYKNIFSDDLNFYTNKLKGNIYDICTWGGWTLMHPYFDNYYPDQVILGKKNKYCDIKTIITKDKKIAYKYDREPNIELITKTDYYYYLIVR